MSSINLYMQFLAFQRSRLLLTTEFLSCTMFLYVEQRYDNVWQIGLRQMIVANVIF